MAAAVETLLTRRATGHRRSTTTGTGMLLAAVLALLPLALLPGAQLRAGTTVQPAKADAFASLPLAAKATVSRVLGRDNRAYRATRTPGGFVADNARHGLSARFGAAGVEVRARGERLGFVLGAWGYGEMLRPVDRATPTASANRIAYRRGALTEWYVNGPLGLQQGFTLAAPPAAHGSGPLTVSVSLTGTLAPVLESEDGLAFQSSSLHYRGLVAFDASGRELPARLELRDRTLLLRVDDAGARYPLTIDPFVQQAKLTASDGEDGDSFGGAVAVSGDTIVAGSFQDDVGANQDQGSAYVFVKSAAGWTGSAEAAKLTASDGAAIDLFGVSVALSGDTVVVGAPGDDDFRGAAYVFVKPASGWASMTETAKLTASDGAAEDALGQGVALSGDVIVVGAPGDDTGANGNQGSAHVFVRPADGWASMTETAKLTALEGAGGNQLQLGFSVAISGDTVVAGAPFNDVGGEPFQGFVYVFVKPSSGWASMTELARLTASDSARLDHLGWSVAVVGDTVVAGAVGDDLGTSQNHGSAYMFVRPTSGWAGMTETAKLTASDGAESDDFGSAVGLTEDTVVVGARFADVGGNFDQGSAYAFVKPVSGWANSTETAKLAGSDAAAGDVVGGVAISGATVVVGGRFAAGGAGEDQGAAYVFGPPELYAFEGFLATAENPPVLNTAKSSNVQKLYFRLGGDQGLDVLADGSPQSRRIDCATKQPLGPLEPAETPTWDSLGYQPHLDRYYYPWKPPKGGGWAGTCREFILTLDDGSVHTAWFRFVG